MATVTGVTAERAQEIADGLITGAAKQGSSLILQTAGGAVFNITNAFVAAYETTPVGGILMTVNSANPSTYLGGGTWVRWGQGRVPVSQNDADAEFNTVEETGGSKTVVLTPGQMPIHNHNGVTGGQSNSHTHTGYTTTTGTHEHTYAKERVQANLTGSGGISAADSVTDAASTTGGGAHNHNILTNGASDDHNHSIANAGDDQAHPNLQPYIVCYMWKRTA